ncbi:hypothetical protein ACFFHI_16755 [Streptomyces palmae]|uniref:hypothetical protein n=1 Tax=Streptomyces palmae TaxID=1701085 RepID=UPI0035E91C6A
MADDLHAVARFLFEAGTLKHARRTGWWMAGVRDPESLSSGDGHPRLDDGLADKDPGRTAMTGGG